MKTSKSARTGQTKAAPDKLAKTGRTSGVALTEAELGTATGGAKSVKIDFGG